MQSGESTQFVLSHVGISMKKVPRRSSAQQGDPRHFPFEASQGHLSSGGIRLLPFGSGPDKV
jgi:hypothetical protein